MGHAIVDDEKKPSAAQIVVADFCLFAGVPSKSLIEKAVAPILVPQNEQWEKLIELVWQDKVEKSLRYSIKKEPKAFDVKKLKGYTEQLDKHYSLQIMDEQI